MSWQPPPAAQTWHAIELYLAVAYQTTPIPLAVRARIELLRGSPADDFYRGAVLEHAPAAEPTRFSLRLGNPFYPHMKLVIERAPDGSHTLFRADTHDRHVQPGPGSPEAAAFAELSRKNQELAEQIESAWEEHGLPTFKKYLREDLARRRAAAAAR